MTRFAKGATPLAVLAAGLVLVGLASAAWASSAQKIDVMGGNSPEINTPSLDGRPIQSPDGLSLYLASNRPGGRGGLDIWMASRSSTTAPWGAPVNLGEPVNSAADDFCPTPVGEAGLFFVSREALPGACGQGDIYFTRRTGSGAWAEPQRLLCAPDGPNSALDEQGPSWVDVSGRLRGEKQLYFSRSSTAPAVAGEVFMAARKAGARFGPATAVTALNDATANDIQPNVRSDGLEVVFSSNRALRAHRTSGSPPAQPLAIPGPLRRTSARPSTPRRASRGPRCHATAASSCSAGHRAPREVATSIWRLAR